MPLIPKEDFTYIKEIPEIEDRKFYPESKGKAGFWARAQVVQDSQQNDLILKTYHVIFVFSNKLKDGKEVVEGPNPPFGNGSGGVFED